jgi:hypothetical protein
MNRKILILGSWLLILLFSIQEISAQNRNRHGLIGGNYNTVGALVFTGGASYLFGDLGRNDININNVRYQFSLGYRQSFANRLGYRISLHYGLYESTDEGSRFADRGFATTSNIFMFTALGEFNILQSLTARRPWRVYIYGGVGLAYASINSHGNPVVGGASFNASEFAPIIPFGLGFDRWISPNFNIGVEFGWKYAFSHYMDGIRTAGSQNNDILGNISLTFSYRLSGNLLRRRCGC